MGFQSPKAPSQMQNPRLMRNSSCLMIDSTSWGNRPPFCRRLNPLELELTPGIWGKEARGTQAVATPGQTVAEEGQHFIVCIMPCTLPLT